MKVCIMKTNINYLRRKKALVVFMMAGALITGITACSNDDNLPDEKDTAMLGKGMLGDDMTSREFLDNWENCKTVKIAGIRHEVNSPWYGASAQNIPDMIRFDVKKSDGWEMAFCELNDENAKRSRMFGLYNRYTGVLRIFHYIEDPTGYGSELVYLVKTGDSNTDDKVPLYHSMEYSVPANHQYGISLVPKAKLKVGNTNQDAFSCYISPYTVDDVRGVTSYWHCFDLDLSCHAMTGGTWHSGLSQRGHITIYPITSATSDITLTGSLLGSMKGTFTEPQVIETGGGNSMSGVCSTLSTIGGLLGGCVSSSASTFGLMNNQAAPGLIKGVAPYLAAGSMLLNVTSAVLGWVGGEEPVKRDTIPGKIDLGLDATLNLSGLISGYTSNNEGGVVVTPELVNAANSSSNISEGCWSLAADPVVYVSKEDLMCNTDHINLDVRNIGASFSNDEFYNYDARLVSFFDPSSVKLNINTNIYHNIHDVVVTSNYGIYTDRPVGNTDAFRNFMMLDPRPSFSINGGKTSGLLRLNENTVPHIHDVDINDILVSNYETAGNKTAVPSAKSEYKEMDVCNYVNLPGSNINVYGRQISLLGKKMVMMPQVFVPFVKGGEISNPQIPDFVVTVNVTFKCDEGCMQFSKMFIPQVKLIGHNELSGWYTRLKQYSDLCKLKRPVATLANKGSINVYDMHSNFFLDRTLKMLEKVK